MNIAQKIIQSLSSGKQKNSTTGVSGQDFLKYGNRQALTQDWSSIRMSDVDLYTGYSYAAINNRANKVVQLAESDLKTESNKKQEGADEIIHPYLTLIDESDDFTNTEFWYNISTYLDLEGVYYLMAVRAVTPGLVGAVQEFKMLNPYEIQRVVNKETMEVGGYVENRGGLVREIPLEMIIPMRKLNPFSRENNFAMTDAAKESQFTIKQAGDYTRHSLKNNMATPGIIATDVVLDPENFANFKSRIINQEKGTPIFGNGAGTVTWDPMQIDLDKAALSEINSTSRDALFAVSGVSKTTMGIEESGTTRDVSKTQKEKFIEDHIMPQVQMIIDALNQDYKRYYKKEYSTNKLKIVIDNPLGVDKEVELQDIEISTSRIDLYNALIEMGYEPELASQYAMGDIDISELGEPTLEPEISDEEAKLIANGETGASSPSSNDEEVQNSFLALNRGRVGNPYRDSKGRFGSGPSTRRTGKKMVPKGTKDKKVSDAKKQADKDAKEAKTVKDMSGDTAIEYAKTQKQSFTENEKETVSAYQSIYYTSMNSYARQGSKAYQAEYEANGMPRSELSAKEAAQYNKRMDATMSKNKTKDSFYTYRVVSSNKISSVSDPRIASDKGYLSTTVDKASVKEVISNLGAGKKNVYVVKIKVNKGSKGVFTDSITGNEYGEAEFVMPRETKLKVKTKSQKRSKIGDREVILVDAEV